MTGESLRPTFDTMSPARREIVEKLLTKRWFLATERSITDTLVSLPDDPATGNSWNGFLADLAERPDQLGGVEHVHLAEFLKGNFGCIPRFEVRNLSSGALNSYEYHSWRYGPMSGAKGLVLIQTGGQITHFIVLQSEKFATGKLVFDSPGGFADIGADGVANLPERITLEIQQELGAKTLVIVGLHDLGRIYTDPGLTNNNPGLFCAIVDAGQLPLISPTPFNPDWRELTAQTLVRPMRDFPAMVLENGDTFFLSAAARAIAAGILPTEVLAPAA